MKRACALLLLNYLSLAGCHTMVPIGHSTDENGHHCDTYQTRLGGVYETVCEYGPWSAPIQPENPPDPSLLPLPSWLKKIEGLGY